MSRRDDYYRDAHDERVEPHQDLIEEGMGDPEWARVLVDTGQKMRPPGDPTLWANSVTTLIDSAPEGTTPRAFYGQQIVLAQARDRYARSWSISGTVQMTSDWWGNDTEAPPIVGPFPAGITASCWVVLSVLQGIGLVTIEHQILLAAGGWTSNFGLCNNQSTVNGGPYLPTYSDAPALPTSLVSCPFAAIGALIANTINVRGFFVRGPGVTAIPQSQISCLITPYAPGAGI